MTTPTPTATGAHTRITLKRPDFPIQIHATICEFNPVTGAFSAWTDLQPAGQSPALFEYVGANTLSEPTAYYKDAHGLLWEVVR